MWVYNPIIIPYVVVVIVVEPIRERFCTVAPFLDERGRRLVAGAEAFAAGYGGIAAVLMATGMARSTIGRGLRELPQDEPSGRVRRPGAGRKPAIVKSLPSRSRGTRACVPISRGWSNRGRGGIRNRRCVDLQERAPTGRGAAEAGPPSEPYPGGRIAQCGGLQPAREPQGQGGRQPLRPGCAIRPYQRPSGRRFGRTAARN